LVFLIHTIRGCFVRFHSSLFFIWSGQKILNIFLKLLLIKTCSLVVIYFEFFQVSQPHIRTAFTFVLKMRSLVCVECVVECQILFSALNAAWDFRIRAVMGVNGYWNVICNEINLLLLKRLDGTHQTQPHRNLDLMYFNRRHGYLQPVDSTSIASDSSIRKYNYFVTVFIKRLKCSGHFIYHYD